MRSKKRSECPISQSLEIWGDKWTLLIIRDLMFMGKRTYGDFLKSGEGIATNILADRLKMLIETGIIEQTQTSKTKSGSAYKLTDKGVDLLPILAEIHMWSYAHLDLSEDARAATSALRADKAGFIAALTQQLKKDVD